MDFASRITLFSSLDGIALALLALCWLGIGYAIENSPASRPSLSKIMAQYRREWLVQFVTRNPRMFDAQMIGHLRQGAAFFASASMIAIGGGLALIGNTDRLAGVASDLSFEGAPVFVLEVKLLLMLLFVANAFLKFVWAHRLFGYCSVIMSAVPNDPDDPAALPRATKASAINTTAARSFNRGMRSVYFGLASTGWLLGAPTLIATTLLTLFVLWRREFNSQSRAMLAEKTDGFGA